MFFLSWLLRVLPTWSKSCFPVVLGWMANSSSASMVVTRTFTCETRREVAPRKQTFDPSFLDLKSRPTSRQEKHPSVQPNLSNKFKCLKNKIPSYGWRRSSSSDEHLFSLWSVQPPPQREDDDDDDGVKLQQKVWPQDRETQWNLQDYTSSDYNLVDLRPSRHE